MHRIAFLALLGLAGCASGMGAWSKPGATQQALAADINACQLEAEKANNGSVVGFISSSNYQDRCMIAKGWTK